MEIGWTPEEVEQANDAVRRDGADPFARYHRGRLLHIRGDLEAALADFDEACRLDPPAASHFFSRAVVQSRLGRYDLAVASYERALQLEPADATARFERGMAHAGMGDFAAALADWQEAVRRNPSVLAVFAYEIEPGSTLEPEFPRMPINGLPFVYVTGPGDIWDQQGVIAQSVPTVTHPAEHDPRRALALLAQGRLRCSRRQFEAALDDFAEAARLDEKLLLARLSRAAVAHALARSDEALADVDAAVALEPGSPVAHYWKGLVLSGRDEQTLALASYDEAIRLDPALAPAYVGRAGARLADGKLEAALADCQEALRVDPNLSDAYTMRGEVRRKLGNGELAAQDFNLAAGARFDHSYDRVTYLTSPAPFPDGAPFDLIDHVREHNEGEDQDSDGPDEEQGVDGN